LNVLVVRELKRGEREHWLVEPQHVELDSLLPFKHLRLLFRGV